MDPFLIALATFLGVSTLVVGVGMLLRDKPSHRLEDRLDLFTGRHTPGAQKEGSLKQKSVLAEPLDDRPGLLERALRPFGNVRLLLAQADTSLDLPHLALACAVTGLMGVGLAAAMDLPLTIVPVPAVLTALLPVVWLLWRRKRRLKRFAVQLPDAMEMLARSLRSGQSLQAGFNLVATEMAPPLGKEFGRVFEEQNLGVPMEESLDDLTQRVPNLDLKFFATAVILQRQTGGDLAEILDKIGSLIRQRFQIWGQVQALTGEGRLSGIVLMALPVLLFVAVYYLNPDYVMLLFTDQMGKKMLAVAVFLQVLGALVIRKIVNIKV